VAKLIDAGTGDVLLNNLEVADTFWKRFKGLQLRRSMSADSGLLITPCSSLHTCFMRFSIDVIMLDKANVVLGLKRDVVPWRALFCDRGTTRVIEVMHGAVEIAAGTRLDWS
jgi:uncharacterized protein